MTAWAGCIRLSGGFGDGKGIERASERVSRPAGDLAWAPRKRNSIRSLCTYASMGGRSSLLSEIAVSKIAVV